MINNTIISEVIRFDKCTNGEKSLGANSSNLILDASATRNYAAIINNSSVEVTLVLAEKEKAFLNKGIILKPYGGSFEINSSNLYVGKISAIAGSDCKLSYVECN